MSSVTRSSFVSSQPVRLACLLLAGSLAGCSSTDIFSSDKVDYRSAARQTSGLDVPPDLTQLARDNRAQTPQGGVISAAALQQQQGGAARPASTATASSVALNAAGDVRLERSGTDRWLRTSQTPEQLWPQLRAFWQERGFELTRDQADIGIMETSWNENRAKLPQDIVRATIGKVFDGLYSTGERDMYRTRVERASNGATEIFVSHRGMQEVYSSNQKDQTVWQPRPADPQLEAEMLSRLMLKLGGKEDDAKAVLAGTAAPAATTAAATGGAKPSNASSRPLSEVPDSLLVNEGFDRAWRRVGQSLDRHGFTIEDRDRPQGLFFLRYADPNQAGKEEPNFFQKLFSSDTTPAAVRYRVSVKSEGERTTVMVLDSTGKQQTNENAKRILSMLMDDLR
jgi:outer membrane protein assembly factor BamC